MLSQADMSALRNFVTVLISLFISSGRMAKITFQEAQDGADAMKLMIELLCKTNIGPLLISGSITW
jgi:hypothetical protein